MRLVTTWRWNFRCSWLSRLWFWFRHYRFAKPVQGNAIYKFQDDTRYRCIVINYDQDVQSSFIHLTMAEPERIQHARVKHTWQHFIKIIYI